jgi:hypothetical protein
MVFDQGEGSDILDAIVAGPLWNVRHTVGPRGERRG